MITMIKHYRMENLKSQLAELEDKILKSKTLTRFDLQELEGLSNEIQILYLQIANVLK